jgi:hypothetical protein
MDLLCLLVVSLPQTNTNTWIHSCPLSIQVCMLATHHDTSGRDVSRCHRSSGASIRLLSLSFFFHALPKLTCYLRYKAQPDDDTTKSPHTEPTCHLIVGLKRWNKNRNHNLDNSFLTQSRFTHLVYPRWAHPLASRTQRKARQSMRLSGRPGAPLQGALPSRLPWLAGKLRPFRSHRQRVRDPAVGTQQAT